MIRFRSITAWLLLVLSCLAPSSAFAARPNIVFFYIDDLGWKDVGFMGSTYYETPNIDRLASEGMVFHSAYSCGPNCAPSRACLMSGQYSPRHGILRCAWRCPCFLWGCSRCDAMPRCHRLPRACVVALL